MSAAAQNLTPVHFELGGKSANIIFDDADLDRAIDGSLVNIFSNSGQICIGSRSSCNAVADEFIKQFVTRAKALRVGTQWNLTEVGPMTFVAHRDRVLSCIEKAKAEGAELLVGSAVMMRRAILLNRLYSVLTAMRCRFVRRKCLGPS